MSTSKGDTASKEDLSKIIKKLQDENATLKAREPAVSIINPKDPLKIPPPVPFEGRPGTLRTYLTQARLYNRFQHGALTLESDRVLAVAAYLKGDAAAWFEPSMREYLEKGNANKCEDSVKRNFNSCNEFERRIKEAFGNPAEERDYERQLLQLRHVTLAQEYAAKFQQISAHLEMDDVPLMMYSYKGLKEPVKDEIIKEDRPDTIGAYMERATRIDNRQFERRLEKKHQGWTSAGARHGSNDKKKRHGTSWGQHSGPMELDAAIRNRSAPRAVINRSAGPGSPADWERCEYTRY